MWMGNNAYFFPNADAGLAEEGWKLSKGDAGEWTAERGTLVKRVLFCSPMAALCSERQALTMHQVLR